MDITFVSDLCKPVTVLMGSFCSSSSSSSPLLLLVMLVMTMMASVDAQQGTGSIQTSFISSVQDGGTSFASLEVSRSDGSVQPTVLEETVGKIHSTIYDSALPYTTNVPSGQFVRTSSNFIAQDISSVQFTDSLSPSFAISKITDESKPSIYQTHTISNIPESVSESAQLDLTEIVVTSRVVLNTFSAHPSSVFSPTPSTGFQTDVTERVQDVSSRIEISHQNSENSQEATVNMVGSSDLPDKDTSDPPSIEVLSMTADVSVTGDAESISAVSSLNEVTSESVDSPTMLLPSTPKAASGSVDFTHLISLEVIMSVTESLFHTSNFESEKTPTVDETETVQVINANDVSSSVLFTDAASSQHGVIVTSTATEIDATTAIPDISSASPSLNQYFSFSVDENLLTSSDLLSQDMDLSKSVVSKSRSLLIESFNTVIQTFQPYQSINISEMNSFQTVQSSSFQTADSSFTIGTEKPSMLDSSGVDLESASDFDKLVDTSVVPSYQSSSDEILNTVAMETSLDLATEINPTPTQVPVSAFMSLSEVDQNSNSSLGSSISSNMSALENKASASLDQMESGSYYTGDRQSTLALDGISVDEEMSSSAMLNEDLSASRTDISDFFTVSDQHVLPGTPVSEVSDSFHTISPALDSDMEIGMNASGGLVSTGMQPSDLQSVTVDNLGSLSFTNPSTASFTSDITKSEIAATAIFEVTMSELRSVASSMNEYDSLLDVTLESSMSLFDDGMNTVSESLPLFFTKDMSDTVDVSVLSQNYMLSLDLTKVDEASQSMTLDLSIMLNLSSRIDQSMQTYFNSDFTATSLSDTFELETTMPSFSSLLDVSAPSFEVSAGSLSYSSSLPMLSSMMEAAVNNTDVMLTEIDEDTIIPSSTIGIDMESRSVSNSSLMYLTDSFELPATTPEFTHSENMRMSDSTYVSASDYSFLDSFMPALTDLTPLQSLVASVASMSLSENLGAPGLTQTLSEVPTIFPTDLAGFFSMLVDSSSVSQLKTTYLPHSIAVESDINIMPSVQSAFGEMESNQSLETFEVLQISMSSFAESLTSASMDIISSNDVEDSILNSVLETLSVSGESLTDFFETNLTAETDLRPFTQSLVSTIDISVLPDTITSFSTISTKVAGLDSENGSKEILSTETDFSTEQSSIGEMDNTYLIPDLSMLSSIDMDGVLSTVIDEPSLASFEPTPVTPLMPSMNLSEFSNMPIASEVLDFNVSTSEQDILESTLSNTVEIPIQSDISQNFSSYIPELSETPEMESFNMSSVPVSDSAFVETSASVDDVITSTVVLTAESSLEASDNFTATVSLLDFSYTTDFIHDATPGTASLAVFESIYEELASQTVSPFDTTEFDRTAGLNETASLSPEISKSDYEQMNRTISDVGITSVLTQIDQSLATSDMLLTSTPSQTEVLSSELMFNISSGLLPSFSSTEMSMPSSSLLLPSFPSDISVGLNTETAGRENETLETESMAFISTTQLPDGVDNGTSLPGQTPILTTFPEFSGSSVFATDSIENLTSNLNLPSASFSDELSGTVAFNISEEIISSETEFVVSSAPDSSQNITISDLYSSESFYQVNLTEPPFEFSETSFEFSREMSTMQTEMESSSYESLPVVTRSFDLSSDVGGIFSSMATSAFGMEASTPYSEDIFSMISADINDTAEFPHTVPTMAASSNLFYTGATTLDLSGSLITEDGSTIEFNETVISSQPELVSTPIAEFSSLLDNVSATFNDTGTAIVSDIPQILSTATDFLSPSDSILYATETVGMTDLLPSEGNMSAFASTSFSGTSAIESSFSIETPSLNVFSESLVDLNLTSADQTEDLFPIISTVLTSEIEISLSLSEELANITSLALTDTLSVIPTAPLASDMQFSTNLSMFPASDLIQVNESTFEFEPTAFPSTDTSFAFQILDPSAEFSERFELDTSEMAPPVSSAVTTTKAAYFSSLEDRDILTLSSFGNTNTSLELSLTGISESVSVANETLGFTSVNIMTSAYEIEKEVTISSVDFSGLLSSQNDTAPNSIGTYETLSERLVSESSVLDTSLGNPDSAARTPIMTSYESVSRLETSLGANIFSDDLLGIMTENVQYPSVVYSSDSLAFGFGSSLKPLFTQVGSTAIQSETSDLTVSLFETVALTNYFQMDSVDTVTPITDIHQTTFLYLTHSFSKLFELDHSLQSSYAEMDHSIAASYAFSPDMVDHGMSLSYAFDPDMVEHSMSVSYAVSPDMVDHSMSSSYDFSPDMVDHTMLLSYVFSLSMVDSSMPVSYAFSPDLVEHSMSFSYAYVSEHSISSSHGELDYSVSTSYEELDHSMSSSYAFSPDIVDYSMSSSYAFRPDTVYYSMSSIYAFSPDTVDHTMSSSYAEPDHGVSSSYAFSPDVVDHNMSSNYAFSLDMVDHSISPSYGFSPGMMDHSMSSSYVFSPDMVGHTMSASYAELTHNMSSRYAVDRDIVDSMSSTYTYSPDIMDSSMSSTYAELAHNMSASKAFSPGKMDHSMSSGYAFSPDTDHSMSSGYTLSPDMMDYSMSAGHASSLDMMDHSMSSGYTLSPDMMDYSMSAGYALSPDMMDYSMSSGYILSPHMMDFSMSLEYTLSPDMMGHSMSSGYTLSPDMMDFSMSAGHAFSPDMVEYSMSSGYTLNPDMMDFSMSVGYAFSPDMVDHSSSSRYAFSPDMVDLSMSSSYVFSPDMMSHISPDMMDHIMSSNYGDLDHSMSSSYAELAHSMSPGHAFSPDVVHDSMSSSYAFSQDMVNHSFTVSYAQLEHNISTSNAFRPETPTPTGTQTCSSTEITGLLPSFLSRTYLQTPSLADVTTLTMLTPDLHFSISLVHDTKLSTLEPSAFSEPSQLEGSFASTVSDERQHSLYTRKSLISEQLDSQPSGYLYSLFAGNSLYTWASESEIESSDSWYQTLMGLPNSDTNSAQTDNVASFMSKPSSNPTVGVESEYLESSSRYVSIHEGSQPSFSTVKLENSVSYSMQVSHFVPSQLTNLFPDFSEDFIPVVTHNMSPTPSTQFSRGFTMASAFELVSETTAQFELFSSTGGWRSDGSVDEKMFSVYQSEHMLPVSAGEVMTIQSADSKNGTYEMSLESTLTKTISEDFNSLTSLIFETERQHFVTSVKYIPSVTIPSETETFFSLKNTAIPESAIELGYAGTTTSGLVEPTDQASTVSVLSGTNTLIDADTFSTLSGKHMNTLQSFDQGYSLMDSDTVFGSIIPSYTLSGGALSRLSYIYQSVEISTEAGSLNLTKDDIPLTTQSTSVTGESETLSIDKLYSVYTVSTEFLHDSADSSYFTLRESFQSAEISSQMTETLYNTESLPQENDTVSILVTSSETLSKITDEFISVVSDMFIPTESSSLWQMEDLSLTSVAMVTPSVTGNDQSLIGLTYSLPVTEVASPIPELSASQMIPKQSENLFDTLSQLKMLESVGSGIDEYMTDIITLSSSYQYINSVPSSLILDLSTKLVVSASSTYPDLPVSSDRGYTGTFSGTIQVTPSLESLPHSATIISATPVAITDRVPSVSDQTLYQRLWNLTIAGTEISGEKSYTQFSRVVTSPTHTGDVTDITLYSQSPYITVAEFESEKDSLQSLAGTDLPFLDESFTLHTEHLLMSTLLLSDLRESQSQHSLMEYEESFVYSTDIDQLTLSEYPSGDFSSPSRLTGVLPSVATDVLLSTTGFQLMFSANSEDISLSYSRSLERESQMETKHLASDTIATASLNFATSFSSESTSSQMAFADSATFLSERETESFFKYQTTLDMSLSQSSAENLISVQQRSFEDTYTTFQESGISSLSSELLGTSQFIMSHLTQVSFLDEITPSIVSTTDSEVSLYHTKNSVMETVGKLSKIEFSVVETSSGYKTVSNLESVSAVPPSPTASLSEEMKSIEISSSVMFLEDNSSSSDSIINPTERQSEDYISTEVSSNITERNATYMIPTTIQSSDQMSFQTVSSQYVSADSASLPCLQSSFEDLSRQPSEVTSVESLIQEGQTTLYEVLSQYISADSASLSHLQSPFEDLSLQSSAVTSTESLFIQKDQTTLISPMNSFDVDKHSATPTMLFDTLFAEYTTLSAEIDFSVSLDKSFVTSEELLTSARLGEPMSTIDVTLILSSDTSEYTVSFVSLGPSHVSAIHSSKENSFSSATALSVQPSQTITMFQSSKETSLLHSTLSIQVSAHSSPILPFSHVGAISDSIFTSFTETESFPQSFSYVETTTPADLNSMSTRMLTSSEFSTLPGYKNSFTHTLFGSFSTSLPLSPSTILTTSYSFISESPGRYSGQRTGMLTSVPKLTQLLLSVSESMVTSFSHIESSSAVSSFMYLTPYQGTESVSDILTQIQPSSKDLSVVSDGIITIVSYTDSYTGRSPGSSLSKQASAVLPETYSGVSFSSQFVELSSLAGFNSYKTTVSAIIPSTSSMTRFSTGSFTGPLPPVITLTEGFEYLSSNIYSTRHMDSRFDEATISLHSVEYASLTIHSMDTSSIYVSSDYFPTIQPSTVLSSRAFEPFSMENSSDLSGRYETFTVVDHLPLSELSSQYTDLYQQSSYMITYSDTITYDLPMLSQTSISHSEAITEPVKDVSPSQEISETATISLYPKASVQFESMGGTSVESKSASESSVKTGILYSSGNIYSFSESILLNTASLVASSSVAHDDSETASYKYIYTDVDSGTISSLSYLPLSETGSPFASEYGRSTELSHLSTSVSIFKTQSQLIPSFGQDLASQTLTFTQQLSSSVRSSYSLDRLNLTDRVFELTSSRDYLVMSPHLSSTMIQSISSSTSHSKYITADNFVTSARHTPPSSQSQQIPSTSSPSAFRNTVSPSLRVDTLTLTTATYPAISTTTTTTVVSTKTPSSSQFVSSSLGTLTLSMLLLSLSVEPSLSPLLSMSDISIEETTISPISEIVETLYPSSPSSLVVESESRQTVNISDVLIGPSSPVTHTVLESPSVLSTFEEESSSLPFSLLPSLPEVSFSLFSTPSMSSVLSYSPVASLSGDNTRSLFPTMFSGTFETLFTSEFAQDLSTFSFSSEMGDTASVIPSVVVETTPYTSQELISEQTSSFSQTLSMSFNETLDFMTITETLATSLPDLISADFSADISPTALSDLEQTTPFSLFVSSVSPFANGTSGETVLQTIESFASSLLGSEVANLTDTFIFSSFVEEASLPSTLEVTPLETFGTGGFSSVSTAGSPEVTEIRSSQFDSFSQFLPLSTSLATEVDVSESMSVPEVISSLSLAPESVTPRESTQSSEVESFFTTPEVATVSSSVLFAETSFTDVIVPSETVLASRDSDLVGSTQSTASVTLSVTEESSTTQLQTSQAVQTTAVTSVEPSAASSVVPASSVTQSTTATTPTTPATSPPPSTVPTIENSRNDTQFWVTTGFRVRPNTNILSEVFQSQIEKGLANSYYLARIRSQEIESGNYVPLQRRKRLASADSDPDTKVDIISATRDANTPAVEIVHVVEEKGKLLTAKIATQQIKLLSDQEVAIQTGHVVSWSAKPYITPASDDDDDNMLIWIIIGSVAGGVVLITIIIIIICLCCCGNSCGKKSEPDKVGVADIPEDGIVKAEVEKRTEEDAEEELNNAAAPVPLARRGKYTLNVGQEEEEEPVYAQVKKPPPKAPRKKKSSPQSSVEHQEATIENEQELSGEEEEGRPQKKKRKKKQINTGEDLRSVYESQIASLQTTQAPMTYSDRDYTLTSQPTVEEEGDLLENAEEERKKNKQRLRAKKMKERGQDSPEKSGGQTELAYQNAQREIDKVLGPRDEIDEKRKKHRGKKKKDKKEKKGEDNEAFSSDEKKEESLEEARERMHKLLDDAFSLISDSKSSIANKVGPARYSSDEDNSARSKKSHSARSDLGVQTEKTEIDVRTEKKHIPLHVHRTHEAYDKDGLITWSPYRAADDSTLISLPSTQTNMSTKMPQQEKLTTSTFNESLPASLHSDYYATQPAAPIVIKTKELDSKPPPSGSQSRRGSSQSQTNGRHGHSNGTTNHVTIQNPVFDNTIPSRPTDKYSDPYYGLSSYQEIPLSSSIPGQTDSDRSTRNGSMSDRYRDRHRMVSSAPYDITPQERVTPLGVHTAPQRGEDKNLDELDVIKSSLQPGASPQPFINSLRGELQTLSQKKHGESNTTGSPQPRTLVFRTGGPTIGFEKSATGLESLPGENSTDV